MSTGKSLLRIFNTRDAYVLIVGNIIGIGIFTTTGYISQFVNDTGTLIFLWLLGGFLAFCGGLTYAELASRIPNAGGDFHYLSRAFHPLLGFLFGWSALLVTYTGSIAVISVGFGYYFINFLPYEIQIFSLTIPVIGLKLTSIRIFAIVITLIFTFINHKGVRKGLQWQGILTFSSIFVLLAYILIGFSSPKGEWANMYPLLPDKISFSMLSRIGVALIGVYFTYSGWTVLAYVAGEVKDPNYAIPRATLLGVITVVIFYVLINFVYILALPLVEMRNIVDIGYVAFENLCGGGLTAVFTVMILIAVTSTLNSTILSGARIYYAMSREGLFFKRFGQLHKEFDTPSQALWLQFGWTVILILSGSFNQLLTYTVFVMVVFGALSGIGLFILRRKQIQQEKPYLAWGYPVTPIIYILITCWIMINTFMDQPQETLAGIILVSSGIPFYYYFRKKVTKE
ncbi:MAG: APC family permease [Calditrichia bacterium]|nr:APC family permease [Calditrichia bacterium]